MIEERTPERGPWTAELNREGRLVLSSDDFNHDAMILQVSGDFATAEDRLAYGHHLAKILTAGAKRAYASRELDDEGKLLSALMKATSGEHAELLQRAADEIAKLRVGLHEANETLRQLSAHRHFQAKAEKALEPSPFATALQAALQRKAA